MITSDNVVGEEEEEGVVGEEGEGVGGGEEEGVALGREGKKLNFQQQYIYQVCL